MQDKPSLIKSTGCFEKRFPFFISRDFIDGYVSLHQHDFVEIEYTVSGRGTERINGVSHTLTPGNLTVLFPWDCHDLQAGAGENLCFLKLNLDMELFLVETSPLYRMREIPFEKPSRLPCIQVPQEKRERMLGIFEELEQEFEEDGRYREDLFFAKATEILVAYGRQLTVSESRSKRERVWDVVEYIHQNFGKDVTCSETAARFGLDSAVVDRMLLEHTGMSFDELLADTRIRNACARLIYHTVSIGQIARETGFVSEDSFSKIFKRYKGMSPANYRKKYKARQENLFSPEELDGRVLYYIHRHYGEDISLTQVAREFHYNENYLSQVIKNQTGQTFSELLNEIRVFHAAAVLLTTDHSVTRVGFDAGFQSSETFLRVFKKHYGCSPSAWREKESAHRL